MDETTKKLREYVYGQVEHMVGNVGNGWYNHDQGLTQLHERNQGLMQLYVQFKMLDTLESIDNGVGDMINRLVAVEDAIGNLNSGRG